jgi:Fe2+/Zn2+ uptake regulation proteins
MFKRTPARLAVIEFLTNSKTPVDVEQIIKFLRLKNLATNKVTVYRIVDFLYKNGLIDRFEFGEGKFRYEIKKKHHHHSLCNKCGKIEDIQGEYLDKLEKEIFENTKFKVTGHSLEFFGICKNCQI